MQGMPGTLWLYGGGAQHDGALLRPHRTQSCHSPESAMGTHLRVATGEIPRAGRNPGHGLRPSPGGTARPLS